MQRNPINLIREQIDNIGLSDNKQSNTEEAAKEQERLNALHEGWLKHPVTVRLIRDLTSVNVQEHAKVYRYVNESPHQPNPFLPKAAVLAKLIDCITNNIPYA